MVGISDCGFDVSLYRAADDNSSSAFPVLLCYWDETEDWHRRDDLQKGNNRLLFLNCQAEAWFSYLWYRLTRPKRGKKEGIQYWSYHSVSKFLVLKLIPSNVCYFFPYWMAKVLLACMEAFPRAWRREVPILAVPHPAAAWGPNENGKYQNRYLFT